MTAATGSLVLLRHGESVWNAEDRFAGWVDVPLTDRGRGEARRSGELLAAAGLLPDVVHTSLLRRAVSTAAIALDAADRHWIDVHRSWRLNERHYGALQGRPRAEARSEFGAELLTRWRRSYGSAPPAILPGSAFGQDDDLRYRQLGVAVPATESLADVSVRLLPYWHRTITADLRRGRTVLVVSHGNTLRALITHLDGVAPEDVGRLTVPTGVPIHYELDDTLQPRTPGGVRWDDHPPAPRLISPTHPTER